MSTPARLTKDSGLKWLGLVPSHWQQTTIRAITKPVTRRSRSDLMLLSVYRDYGIIPKDSRDDNYNRDGSDLNTYKVVQPGNLVLNKMKTWQGSLGVSEYEGIVSPAYIVCELVGDLNPKFVHYLLRSYPYIFEYNRISYGVRVDQWDMRYDDFKQTPIYLPPRAEQDAIVAFLDERLTDIDRYIAAKQRLIELLNEQKAAIINRAVTRGLNPDAPLKESGIKWLGKIPEHWVVAPIYARYWVQLGKMLDGKRITGEYLAPYLRNIDVQWGRINTENLNQMDFPPWERERFALHPGDLLVCEGGEVGRCAIWKGELGECYYQKALHRLRPRKPIDKPQYLYYVIYTAAQLGIFVAEGNPNTIDHLTAEKLKKHRFAFPPLDEQERIAGYLDCETAEIEGLISKTKETIQKLQEYRIALIAEAVMGKRDVKRANE